MFSITPEILNAIDMIFTVSEFIFRVLYSKMGTNTSWTFQQSEHIVEPSSLPYWGSMSIGSFVEQFLTVWASYFSMPFCSTPLRL